MHHLVTVLFQYKQTSKQTNKQQSRNLLTDRTKQRISKTLDYLGFKLGSSIVFIPVLMISLQYCTFKFDFIYCHVTLASNLTALRVNAYANWLYLVDVNVTEHNLPS